VPSEDAGIERLVAAWKSRRGYRAQELREEARRLARGFYAAGALQVILFGSVAKGNVGSSSDLDLVVVAPLARSEPFSRRFQDVLEQLHPTVPVDLWVYTPGEWEEVKDSRWFLREEVRKKGVILDAR
jgi:predicted nucleotidyltransferase